MIRQKLLGTAFASADLLFEVDAAGIITFAVGSTRGTAFDDASDLLGRSWTDLFGAKDREALGALLRGTVSGERRGPLPMTLVPAGGASFPAALSVFRLPERADGALSCSLSRRPGGAETGADLIPAEQFPETVDRIMRQAEAAGLPLRVDLVELKGLTDAVRGPDGPELRERVEAILRVNSFEGGGASEVAPDRFAVLRPASAPVADIDSQIRDVAGPAVEAVSATMPVAGGTIDTNMRALRYALDRYIEKGAEAAAIDFSQVVQKTADDTMRLKSALADGAWSLVYQPVVSLSEDKMHHFEALARFEPGESPTAAICLAEELGLIVELDLAIFGRVVKTLSTASRETRIAVNLSAVSLMQPRMPEALADLTAHNPALRPRLLIELTETETIDDLETANSRIQALRALGHEVCLDDFGAGAASLDYLRSLDVDFVKFDGRYIRTLAPASREEVLIKHMVNLCKELGIGTIAEMIEAPEAAKVAHDLGVTLGQGWCFAKPSVDLCYPPRQATTAARPRGLVASWG